MVGVVFKLPWLVWFLSCLFSDFKCPKFLCVGVICGDESKIHIDFPLKFLITPFLIVRSWHDFKLLVSLTQITPIFYAFVSNLGCLIQTSHWFSVKCLKPFFSGSFRFLFRSADQKNLWLTCFWKITTLHINITKLLEKVHFKTDHTEWIFFVAFWCMTIFYIIFKATAHLMLLRRGNIWSWG